jgi:HEAT repeat protein
MLNSICLLHGDCQRCRMVLALLLALLPSLCFAGPITREESERRGRVLEQLKESIAVEATEAGKFAAIAAVMAKEPAVDLRRRILDIATGMPGAALEAFLTAVLTTDKDAGVRSLVATALGRSGSEKSLAVLAKVAASDRTTTLQIGDIGSRSSARRAAIFAIAQLAERFPKLADKAAAELRALPGEADPADKDHRHEDLPHARRQALYQVTGDETLLGPFFDRLKSADPTQRQQGVIAFRFLNLKKAPARIVKALEDESVAVRSTAAMVLGEIGDAKTAEPLMALAADAKQERGVRANAIGALGHMRAAAAADLMEKLLGDADVSANAAVALYRITGKKAKQFPEGYRAD